MGVDPRANVVIDLIQRCTGVDDGRMSASRTTAPRVVPASRAHSVDLPLPAVPMSRANRSHAGPSFREAPGMVTIRPMTFEDVTGAEQAWHAAYSTMRAAHDLAAEPRTAESIQALERRMAHLLHTDPAGSWVAIGDDRRVVGISQALVRDDLWVLSLLGVSPEYQDRQTGKALLDAAVSYGRETARGMILCSRDPRAARRYSLAGFDLHRAVTAWGRVNRRNLPRPSSTIRDGTVVDYDLVARVDRAVRGGAHGPDLIHSVDAGCRLVVSSQGGYAVARGAKPVFVAAGDETTASDLLFAVIGEAGADETTQVAWMTSAQQWAIRASLQAGLELHALGPVMLRGFQTPPAPYLPSGAFG